MRILLFLLKCIVGVLATVGLAVVALLLLGLFAWRDIEQWRAREALPARFVLAVDLDDGIADGPPGVLAGLGPLSGALSLRELSAGLEAAAADPAVGGLVLRLGQSGMSLARAQELRRAFTRFADSGKPAVAFAESFGEGGGGTVPYYLASALPQVWLQPSGSLDFTGFRIEQPYLRALLDDWGIVPRIGQREAYKGVADPINRSAMTAPVRENLQRLLESWLRQVTTEVAAARGQEAARVRALVDEAPFAADQALERGLVDRLGYWDQALAAAGGEARPAVVDLADYVARAPAREPDEPAAEIALVYGLGPVVLGGGDGSPFAGEAMGAGDVVAALGAAAADPEVRAIVFRVDSPGGSYVAADAIWRAVEQARAAGKPVVVSMGGVAASGGYFVAAPADAIVAEPGTITGSIGVVSGKLVLERLWQDLGVNWDGVQAGANAARWSPNRDFTEAQWARLQASLDRVYRDFTDKVAEGRGLTREEVLAAAGGRVWSGADAQALGLVDSLGGFPEALATARRLAGLAADAPVRLVDVPGVEERYGRLLRRLLDGGLESLALASELSRRLSLLGPLLEGLPALPGPRLEAVR